MNTELALDPRFNPQAEIKNDKPAAGKEPWNKGKLMGQKPPLKLKEVWEIRIRLRFGKTKSPGRRPRRPSVETGDGHATKNPSAGTILNHGTNAHVSHGLDQASQAQGRGFPVPKPNPRLAAYHHPSVCQDSGEMGRQHRVKPCRLWHPFLS